MSREVEIARLHHQLEQQGAQVDIARAYIWYAEALGKLSAAQEKYQEAVRGSADAVRRGGLFRKRRATTGHTEDEHKGGVELARARAELAKAETEMEEISIHLCQLLNIESVKDIDTSLSSMEKIAEILDLDTSLQVQIAKLRKEQAKHMFYLSILGDDFVLGIAHRWTDVKHDRYDLSPRDYIFNLRDDVLGSFRQLGIPIAQAHRKIKIWEDKLQQIKAAAEEERLLAKRELDRAMRALGEAQRSVREKIAAYWDYQHRLKHSLELDITPQGKARIGMQLGSARGRLAKASADLLRARLRMVQTGAGFGDFGEYSEVRQKNWGKLILTLDWFNRFLGSNSK